LRRVTISLQRDESGRPFLALQNSPALTPADSTTEAELHMLSADVTGFSVRYRHPQEGDWRDTWEERDVMPAAIEYTIAFGGTDGRTEPLLVTRALDLPTAEGSLLTAGEFAKQNTTNQVLQQNIATPGTKPASSSVTPKGGLR